MAFFEWNDTFSVNIREIDEQHKKLVSLLNDIHTALMGGEGRAAASDILAELVRYTKNHFATEEHLMKTHGYPDFLGHKTKHDKMTAKVGEYVARYETEKLSTAIQLKDFLKKWLTEHILKTDKAYGPFLNEKGVH